MFILLVLALVGEGAGQATPPLPQCWTQYGECLDSNQPPLDLTNVVKPKLNPNVVSAIPNIFTLQDCLSACENTTDCRYFTLYSPNVTKACQLVGFNLGNACQRLSNVCVLYRDCQVFSTTCGTDCPTGRRLIQDRQANWFTLVIGGVADPREMYQDNIEIVRKDGVSCSVMTQSTANEGAAGTFIQATGLIMVCGGFRNGAYTKACQTMTKQGSWTNPATDMLVTARGFHAMAAVGNRAYAFGGFNNVDGMLDSVEMYVAATSGPTATPAVTWALATTTTLPSKRSHMCAVALNFNGTDMIFLLGGYDISLTYLSDVVKFTVNPATGALTKDATFSVTLPMDYTGTPTGRADMACSYYRLNNWRDGILMTGGYRSAGAWLNTVWFLDLVTVATKPAANPWVRFTDISKQFDQGRHYHGLSIVQDQAFVLGGWSNGPLVSTTSLSECETPDMTRKGAWHAKTSQQLKVAREKFVTIPVPGNYLPASWISPC